MEIATGVSYHLHEEAAMMKRARLNVLLLAVVAGGAPIALAPSPALAGLGEGDGEGGTCCTARATVCYLNLDGEIIKETDSYFVETMEECLDGQE
ncbi:MAG TPA: hypothetical protein VHG08_11700 [Longimicrobium sp.]|nr:hypothetical protein [Longimicrobium sp.]